MFQHEKVLIECRDTGSFAAAYPGFLNPQECEQYFSALKENVPWDKLEDDNGVQKRTGSLQAKCHYSADEGCVFRYVGVTKKVPS